MVKWHLFEFCLFNPPPISSACQILFSVKFVNVDLIFIKSLTIVICTLKLFYTVQCGAIRWGQLEN